MLDVVCWKWTAPGYRSAFSADHVNTLAGMVRRNYPSPHRFSCITDDPRGLDPAIRHIPLWPDLAHLPNPGNKAGPSCYRRLRAFARDAADLIGPRFVSLDLDCVIVGDLRPLWDRPEDFVIWGDTARGTPYNGSMWLLRAGARPQAWEQFHPIRSPQEGKRRGYIGSDQAWLGVVLGPNEARWRAEDGVYSYRNQVQAPPNRGRLPDNARVVFFHGKEDPWHTEPQKLTWVREHYRA